MCFIRKSLLGIDSFIPHIHCRRNQRKRRKMKDPPHHVPDGYGASFTHFFIFLHLAILVTPSSPVSHHPRFPLHSAELIMTKSETKRKSSKSVGLS